MFIPSVVVFDFETALTDGAPSTEFYRSDFRAISCAFAWRDENGSIKTAYREGEPAIRKFLEKCAKDGVPMVAHNLQFEQGVSKCRFPDVSLNFFADTMRLVQVGDNGFPDGFGLEKSTGRWLLEEFHNHKQPYYEYLRVECGVKKGKEGANLHLLPPEMLIDYNISDAKVTLLLYETLTTHFEEIGYDWRFDHALFLSNLHRLLSAKIRGVKVDRIAAKQVVDNLNAEIEAIRRAFFERFTKEITEIESDLKAKKLSRYRSERGRETASLEACTFNIGSTKHLEMLFVGKLGMTPKFTTEKGAPAFGKAFLGAWGDGGKMLEKRRSLIIAKQQAEALLENSEFDGYWHIDLKSVATATGRYGGGQHGKN